MPLILSVKALTRYYRISQGFFKKPALVKALDGISFDLSRKHTLAIVGESGCGKSTLARQLTMIECPTSGKLIIDNQLVNQKDIRQKRALRRVIQMVFQNPYASLNPRKTVQQALNEPLVINTLLTRAQRMEKIAELIDTVGLRQEHGLRYPHMFSGGQRQRIAIARAMILEPKIIVADEPVSALDVSIQAQILNLFMDLQDRFATSYVFISHNLAVVEHIAHEVMVMYLGKIAEYGEKSLIFQCPLHPYTKALISATPAICAGNRHIKIQLQGELPSPLNPPTGCVFHQRCPYAVARCRLEIPFLRTIDKRLVACHRVEEISD